MPLWKSLSSASNGSRQRDREGHPPVLAHQSAPPRALQQRARLRASGSAAPRRRQSDQRRVVRLQGHAEGFTTSRTMYEQLSLPAGRSAARVLKLPRSWVHGGAADRQVLRCFPYMRAVGCQLTLSTAKATLRNRALHSRSLRGRQPREIILVRHGASAAGRLSQRTLGGRHAGIVQR